MKNVIFVLFLILMKILWMCFSIFHDVGNIFFLYNTYYVEVTSPHTQSVQSVYNKRMLERNSCPWVNLCDLFHLLIYECWIILKFLEWNQLTNLIMVFPLMCSWIQKIFYCYFLMSLFIGKLVWCVCRFWAPFNSGYHLIRVFSFCVGTSYLLVRVQYWNHPLLMC